MSCNFLFLLTTATSFIVANGSGGCFGGCFPFCLRKKKNKKNVTHPISLQMINPLIDTTSERTATGSRGSSSQNLLYSFRSHSLGDSQDPFTPRSRNVSDGWSNKADKGLGSTLVNGSGSTDHDQGITLASEETSEAESDRSYTGTVPCCHERNSAEIEDMVRALYYEWKDFVFDKVAINEIMITRMLLNAHLQNVQIGHAQIEDCFSLLSCPGLDAIEEWYQSVHHLFREIPFLMNSQHINIEKLTTNHSLQTIIDYLKDQMGTISESEIIPINEPSTLSHANVGEDSPMQEELIYNLAFRKANHSEEDLPDVYKIGKYRKIQTMKHSCFGMAISLQVAINHLTSQRSALKAILDLVQYEKSPNLFGQIDDAIAFEHVHVPSMMNGFFNIVLSVFPDAQISVNMNIYKKLPKVWMPVSLIRLFLMKLALHSRREYWGRNARNLHMHFTFEQIILENPFDIVLRISMTDNGSPIKEPRLEELNEMMHLREFNRDVKMIDDDFEHSDHWLNDIYFFSSWIATLLNGKFGIKNLYKGTGEIQNKHNSTREIYLEFSILRKTAFNTSIDAEQIDIMGVNEMTLRNALSVLMTKGDVG